MKGRVNGMYNWRRGWRASVLNERNGIDITLPSNEDIPNESTNVNNELLKHEDAWRWWHEVCGNPKYILAPMIGQSEMCFRLLCRQIGNIHLCYTPMYLASNVLDGQHDDELIHSNSAPYQDRPLICQLAGNNTEELIAAGRYVQSYVDAIDVNLGCPQRCADIGNYGSFLPERDLDLVILMITELVKSLTIPITVKIRLLPGHISHTIEYVLRLQATGIYAICIHGRTRHQKEYQGPADWSAIKLLKSILNIPVIANGSIINYYDAQACFQYTNVDAVMSGTGLLRNPSLFCKPETYLSSSISFSRSLTTLTSNSDHHHHHPQHNLLFLLHILGVCQRYLQLASSLIKYPGTISVNGKNIVSVIRDHFFAMLQIFLMDTHNHDIWSLLSSQSVQSIEQFQAILELIYHRSVEEGTVEIEVDQKIQIGAFQLRDSERKIYSLKDIKNSNWESKSPTTIN